MKFSSISLTWKSRWRMSEWRRGFVKLFIATLTTNFHVESFQSFSATQYFFQVQYSEHEMMWKNFRTPRKRKLYRFTSEKRSLKAWRDDAILRRGFFLLLFRGWMNTESNRKFNETKCWDGIAIFGAKSSTNLFDFLLFLPLIQSSFNTLSAPTQNDNNN